MKAPNGSARRVDIPAGSKAEVRPTRGERRQARRDRLAALVAAGHYVPGGPRSHYQRTEIAEVARAHVEEAPRQQARLVVEPNWDQRSAPKSPLPVSLFTTRGSR
jgi:hypothetical protein